VIYITNHKTGVVTRPFQDERETESNLCPLLLGINFYRKWEDKLGKDEHSPPEFPDSLKI
jgi:hypothetical protein